MQGDKMSRIKAQLAEGSTALAKEDLEWLVKRLEELGKENEWLKRELAYAEHQGEISF